MLTLCFLAPPRSDPRKLVVTEFRIVYSDAAAADVVYQLDTPAGVAAMQASPLVIKEGAEFKFRISFRVNHEILAGLRFVNKRKKMGFSDTEEVTIGSFAPASAPHVFEFPRFGYNDAPSGMLYRGTYTCADSFVDSDGVEHLKYTYKITIAKDWPKK